jgi:hypothetical protein
MNAANTKPNISVLWRWPAIFVLAILWAAAALVSKILLSFGAGANKVAGWALDCIEALAAGGH